VQVGVAGPSVWVRIEGRGTFQNSAGLKEFAAEMTRRGHRDFIVDLATCELMDSTFLGTLTGIALGLPDGGKLTVIRANERNRSVMQNLGLDRIFAVLESTPVAAPGRLEDAETNPPQTARREAIVQAHENLAAVNPENAIRFKDVLDFLQQKSS
jgi:anti-anti-sigma regulatory factor